MFSQFITEVIKPESFKTTLTEYAMRQFASEEGVLLVHSPVLYRLYTLFAENHDEIEDRPTFYRKAGAYLYYERFNCKHGDEFYYYIKFNEDSLFYIEHKYLLEMLILAADPSVLTDYSGKKNLTGYNKPLKENN
jgi:hypothetical protein